MTDAEIRALSSLIFGNAYRLEAAAAIGRLEGKPISVTAVARESGLDHNRAQEQVARFARARLLVPERDPSLRRKDYRTVDTSYWRLAALLLSELKEREEL